MKNFQNLKKACSKYPEIQLQVNAKAKTYKQPKVKAKDGFINKFCK